MQFITEWISNIILLILLATILELLLPNSSLQRYVKMVVGLLLLSMILNPLFSIFSKDLNAMISNIDFTYAQTDNMNFSLENKKKEIQSVQLAYISEQVAVQLMRQVEEEMVQQFDKEISSIDVTLENFLEDENYMDHLLEITIHLQPLLEEENSLGETIKPVALVTINMNQEKETLEETDNENEIHMFLSKTWKIPKEKITVVMEGGR